MSAGGPVEPDPLTRIADALERLAPPAPAPPAVDAATLTWDGASLCARPFAPLPLALLTGLDRQRDRFVGNLRRHARGLPAHDALLWGARGTGKSALVKAAVGAVRDEGARLTLVQATGDALGRLPALFDRLADAAAPVLVFVDDLGVEDATAARGLRSLLDGGIGARPPAVRLAVTSNRRHLVERDAEAEARARTPADAAEDALALVDRFGLVLGFHPVDQPGFLTIVERYAAAFALRFDPDHALAFAHVRGGRSGRVAWHYLVELAGAAGRSLSLPPVPPASASAPPPPPAPRAAPPDVP